MPIDHLFLSFKEVAMKTDDWGYPTTGPFTNANLVGGRNGDKFSECRIDEGIVVKKLGVWSNDKGLEGLKVTYSDDSVSKVHGSTKGDFNEITIAPKETVTSAVLWGNGKGTRSGHITLHTSADQTFDHGKDIKGQDAYPTDVGSGILAGVCGRSGAEIDCLCLIFIRGVESMKVGEVKYGALPKPGEQGAPKPVIIDDGTIVNDGEADLNWGFTNKVTLTYTHTHTTAVQWHISNKVSVKWSFEAGVPEISKTSVEVAGEFEWGWDRTRTTTDTDTTTRDLTWNIGGVMKPKSKPIYCIATAVQGLAEVDYSWKRTLFFTNPKDELSFRENGKFSKIEYLQATARATNDAGEIVAGDPMKLSTSALARLPVKLDKTSITRSQAGSSENRAAVEVLGSSQAAPDDSADTSPEPQTAMVTPLKINSQEAAPGFGTRTSITNSCPR